MPDDRGPSGVPCSAAAPQEEQATGRSAVRLFSGRAISQLRVNLSRAANVPLFGLHKQASAPRSLPALSKAADYKIAAVIVGKQCPEQPSTRTALSTPKAQQMTACLPPGAATKRPEPEELPIRLEHSLSNLEVLRTLGECVPPPPVWHVYSRMLVPESVNTELGWVSGRHGHVWARASGALPPDRALLGAQGAEEGGDPAHAPGAQCAQGEANPGLAAAPVYSSHVRCTA